ncbi:MAG: hypothetical protein IJW63_12130 [Lachnospiraceae bacterium]|nr:hypothetical protein [Lachnospiraceae bacterium]
MKREDILEQYNLLKEMMSRFLMGEKIAEKIKEIYEFVEENKMLLNEDTRKRNKVLKGSKNLLKMGIRTSEYGAFMATIIQTDDEFKRLRKLLQGLGLWDDDLSKLDEESKSIVLSTHADIGKEG